MNIAKFETLAKMKKKYIIKTSIGICGILPFNFINGIDKTIIDIENLSDAA